MKKALILFILLASAACAQTFSTYQTCSLSTSACVLTIQQPPQGTAKKNYRFISTTVSTTVAISFNIELSYNLASATAGTNYCIDCATLNSITSDAKTYTSSNASAGNIMAQHQLASGMLVGFDLSKFFFYASSPQPLALTFRTNSVTGTVSIVTVWQEVTN